MCFVRSWSTESEANIMADLLSQNKVDEPAAGKPNSVSKERSHISSRRQQEAPEGCRKLQKAAKVLQEAPGARAAIDSPGQQGLQVGNKGLQGATRGSNTQQQEAARSNKVLKHPTQYSGAGRAAAGSGSGPRTSFGSDIKTASVFSILLLLLRDSPNYKIRIQAAAALAVPATVPDYGGSFSDVIQGVEHAIENLSSDQITPSSFRYRIALEKQLTSTMLHVLALASSASHQPIEDFLIKKASFLEEWFKVLSLSLEETSTELEAENNCRGNQKKEMISRAIRSLIKVYESRNHLVTAEKFDKLATSKP
ncbi:ARM repeat superfamily protein [Actinidia rufa]|uniref:ARM repeat superfamily protein n=1 Tax=Actinidia rufa TaxID=165716 RepID=A0A7J0DYY3_9ERIC|nr:ARM repeat superfamily protein [Actinidia rufa]